MGLIGVPEPAWKLQETSSKGAIDRYWVDWVNVFWADY